MYQAPLLGARSSPVDALLRALCLQRRRGAIRRFPRAFWGAFRTIHADLTDMPGHVPRTLAPRTLGIPPLLWTDKQGQNKGQDGESTGVYWGPP